MKKGLVIGLAATALAAAVASLESGGVSAGPLERNDAGRTVQAHDIAANVRAVGLDPNGEPVLHGRYYALRARDPRGVEMRVLADAQHGEILSIAPAQRARAFRPSYGGGARIIHIPQPDDAVAEADDRGDVGGVSDRGYEERPAPVRKVRPAPRPRSEAPRIKRHIVSSAPPPPPRAANTAGDHDKALTPVYPTPDFGPKTGEAKFDRLPPPESETAAPSQRLE